MDIDRALAASLLGCPAHEVTEVVENADGIIVGMFDGQRYIVTPEADDRQSGIMFYGTPMVGYRGSFPIFTPSADTAPLEATPQRGTVVTTGDPGALDQAQRAFAADQAAQERVEVEAETDAAGNPAVAGAPVNPALVVGPGATNAPGLTESAAADQGEAPATDGATSTGAKTDPATSTPRGGSVPGADGPVPMKGARP